MTLTPAQRQSLSWTLIAASAVVLVALRRTRRAYLGSHLYQG